MFRLESVSVSLGNRCTNCVAHRAGSPRSQSASSTAAAENPSLWKLPSKCQGTRWLSGGGKWDKEGAYSDFGSCNLQFIYRTLCFCFSRDFLNSLRLYRTYYGGLADQLCVSELASGDGLPCWNGTDMVKRYVFKGGRHIQQVSQ